MRNLESCLSVKRNDDGSFNVEQVDICVEAFSGDAYQALLHEDPSQLNMAIDWNSDCVKACQAPLR